MPFGAIAVALLQVLSGRLDAAEPSVEWRVRLYRVGGLSDELVKSSQAALTRILVGSGIRVVLVDCDRSPDCRQPLTADEFVARLVDGYSAAGSAICGAANPGIDGERGVLLTVYAGCLRDERVRLIQSRQIKPVALRLTEADMAAAVMIHEVVHLALPEEEHGHGLWKGGWSDGDWADLARGRLRLSAEITRQLTASDYAMSLRRRGSTRSQRLP